MSDDKQHLYVLMTALRFDACAPPLMTAPGDPKRFLPVFDSMEAAEKWADGKPITVLEVEATDA